MKNKISSLLVFLMGMVAAPMTFAGKYKGNIVERFENLPEKCKKDYYNIYKYDKGCDYREKYCHMTYPDGSSYNGECKDGKIMEGEGEFIDKNGLKTRGFWKDHGSRVFAYYYDNYGRGNVYHFDFPWVDGDINGHGTTELFDKNNRLISRYEGEFRNGKMNGGVKATNEDGKVYKQYWEMGNLISSELILPKPKEDSSK
ncbi:hypothetical protein FACS1894152_1930 [Bacilli bacterium]|nr:hypothetical protein FACS1894152_1930 [Bacilli bacterium]